MKRVHVRNGLKQRLNEIIGTDVTAVAAGEVPDLTPWSVEAAMLSNMRRIVTGIVGGAYCGRVISGLEMSKIGSYAHKISAGYGFTKSGNIVHLKTDITASGGIGYYYLKHKMVELSDTSIGGKKTNFIGRSGEEIITYDDLSNTLSAPDDSSGDILIFSSSRITEDGETEDGDGYLFDDLVFIGQVTDISGSVVKSTDVGFGPGDDGYNNFQNISVNENANIAEDLDVGKNLDVHGEASFDGAVEFDDIVKLSGAASKVQVGSAIGITQTISLSSHTITVINGIITAFS